MSVFGSVYDPFFDYDPLFDLDLGWPWTGGYVSDRGSTSGLRGTRGVGAQGGDVARDERGGQRDVDRAVDYGGETDSFVRRIPIQDRVPRHASSRVMTEREGDVVWRPATDVLANDNEFIIHVDLPGVPKSDIQIDLRDRELVIQGESKQHEAYKAASSRVRERSIGKFRKHVYLPRNMTLDKDHIQAEFNNGLLEIKIPRTGEKQTTISIQ
ncbi:4591_t:CDS:2 [Ambispora leptoticha]|uniref:4591_t:CDS:1 n=1 Tax=Ambispora leptoticha TaxID=144679 RepID=A0A9N9F2P7_9GLOM|nr:4591_t:CDS:2 [Ambispora leptoticha]